jgi:hypothetical protein
MTVVGTYVRDLGARTARLIENALDWEHLPFVHASSFGSISIVSGDAGGWVADATLTGGMAVSISLTLDPDRMGWVTVTSSGGNVVGRIESRVEETGRDTCRVSVTFIVPGLAQDQRAAAGAYYTTLYAQLYDEDEALMIARAKAIEAGAAAHKQSRIVTLASGQMANIPLVCPHQGLPLTGDPDGDGIITARGTDTALTL